MENLVEQAFVFAAMAHSNQKRKGTTLPYIIHTAEAAAIVATMTEAPEVIAAAVLHDTVEDCNVQPQQLERLFGSRVTELVMHESEQKEADAAGSWKRRKQATVDQLRDADTDVKMICLGDKLSNIRAMIRDEAKVGDALWERFNQKDKKEHAWYYRSVAKVTADLRAYGAWQEYSAAVDKLFGPEE